MDGASSTLNGSELGHGDQRNKEVPKMDLSKKEKGLLGFAAICMVMAAAVGGVYYYEQYEVSQQNPVASFSFRNLMNEDFPVQTMTIIPVLSLSHARKCKATDDFTAYFGWEGRMTCSVNARWNLVKSMWVASVELPFYWYFNATGQFVRFKDDYKSTKGGKGCKSNHEIVACPNTTQLPDYGAFDSIGLQCDIPTRYPQVDQSGLYFQFHSEARNVTSELMANEAYCADDPGAFLVRHFKTGVFYPFDRDKGSRAYYNYLFRIKLHEHIFANKTRIVRLHNGITDIPLTGGSWWKPGRHYFTVAVDESVMVTKEYIQMTVVGAVTAFATSANTLLSIFGFIFTTKAAVPLHFAFGNRAAAYRRHIVVGDSESDVGSETSSAQVEMSTYQSIPKDHA